MFGQHAYRNSCRFCHGKGCFDCDVKGNRAREDSLNNPIVFRTDSPEDMERLGKFISKLTEPVSQEKALEDALSEVRRLLSGGAGRDERG